MIKLTLANLVEVFRLLLASLAVRFIYKKGSGDEQLKQSKKLSKSREKVRAIHHRLKSDPAYRRRMREYFKRK